MKSECENHMKSNMKIRNIAILFFLTFSIVRVFANMPTHCIYAMDKVKSISGEEGIFQQQLGETIYKRIVPVDKTWGLSIKDYQNNSTVLFIEPPAIPNKAGMEIGYTIAIFMKTANDNDMLDDYVNNFISKDPNKKKINFSDKYDKMVAYEIIDKTMYQDIGGGHLYVVGVEQNEPKYAGLLLEEPIPLPDNAETGKVTYYRATESKDRIKGKIFYAILLYSCEDINEKSFSLFKSYFENQIIIE